MATGKTPNEKNELSIFVTEQDRQSTDITEMSDFIANRIRNLAITVAREDNGILQKITPAELTTIGNLLHSHGAIMHGGYEYVLDFDSLPADILEKYKKGIYKLGPSRQVEDNLRAVLVDEHGTRVKDITIKQAERVADPAQQMQQMQNLAIQMQLKQINTKLDILVEMQGYHIDFSRNNAIIQPFFNARDKVVHAQNEPDKEKQRVYLDGAVSELESAINAIYLDIQTVQKRFFMHTRLPIGRIQRIVNRYIGFISEDLHLLSVYNSVLYQILDYMGKDKDKEDAYNKYRKYMLGFYTKAVGSKQIPLSLQIHNAFDGYTADTMDSWKSMTDEMVPVLQQSRPMINGAYIVTVEDAKDEQE